MNFDRLARHYDWLEAIVAGGRLQRARTAFLEEARAAKSVLLIGEGHGRFLLELCKRSHGPITYVDASERMLQVASERLRQNGIDREPVRFVHASIQAFDPPERFEWVATHFFLDCFGGNKLEGVVRKIAALMAPGGKWMVADFQVPDRGWRHWRARGALALAHAFFRCTVGLQTGKITDPRPILERNQLRKCAAREFNFGLIYADLWERNGE